MKKILIKKCCAYEGCNMMFETIRKNQIYCSKQCAIKAFLMKQKLKKEKESKKEYLYGDVWVLTNLENETWLMEHRGGE